MIEFNFWFWYWTLAPVGWILSIYIIRLCGVRRKTVSDPENGLGLFILVVFGWPFVVAAGLAMAIIGLLAMGMSKLFPE